MSNIREALNYISPDLPRDEWVNILMAIKSELGNDGYVVADEWSKQGVSYSPADFKATWKSIKPNGGITIGTLFKLAKDNGFEPNYLEPMVNPISSAEREQQRLQAELQAQKEIEERLAKITNFWQTLQAKNPPQPCTSHPYLERKKIKPHGIHYLPNYKDKFSAEHGDNPLILWVMRNRQLAGFQLIYPDGFKRFIAGTVKQGGYYMVTRLTNEQTHQAKEIVLCEGFATACSVIENIYPNTPTFISFDAGNLSPVAKYLRSQYPNKNLIIMADNDKANELETGYNAGIANAKKAVAEDNRHNGFETIIKYPNFKEDTHLTDWNDFFNYGGVYSE